MVNEPSAGDPGSGLREKSVGLRGDWIASITNVAPTAATTLTMAALIAASGLTSPLALLVAGAAMLCCAVAYHRLNNLQASAAATVICLLVVAIAVIGVKVTIRFEGWVILVEYMIIASLAIWGLVTELTSHAKGITAPTWSWFTTSHSPGGSTRADRGGRHRHVPARRLGFAHLPGR
jgi:hypothetical protein